MFLFLLLMLLFFPDYECRISIIVLLQGSKKIVKRMSFITQAFIQNLKRERRQETRNGGWSHCGERKNNLSRGWASLISTGFIQNLQSEKNGRKVVISDNEDDLPSLPRPTLFSFLPSSFAYFFCGYPSVSALQVLSEANIEGRPTETNLITTKKFKNRKRVIT